ncbi:hypothetical protein [Paraflavitalea speifideaquila]|uniref:hypothetical protein n=1 Tax=Paraflavitalea speifideaquila TaxID=3076558 RepID=UPI0028F0D60D|nr:hypothetical protein [Paraflavitalea speifideiaquila]
MAWLVDKIIDWALGGKAIALDGSRAELGTYYFAFGFDNAITSSCGVYAFLYKRLGTKGLLLKNGHELREINRPYYQSEEYEYPAAFISLPGGRTLLAHCPKEYCRLDFEDVETAEILTHHPDRKPADFFHSRLEVSPGNRSLLSKGWHWHPWSAIELFDIAACLANPVLLDKGSEVPGLGLEINTAGFIDQEQVLVGSSIGEPFDDTNNSVPPLHLAIWNTSANTVSTPIKVQGEFGNVFPINQRYCWDLYKYPKVIDLQSGEIIARAEDINTGDQDSSLIGHLADELPLMAYNSTTKQLAIRQNGVVEVLGWEVGS